MKDLRKVAKQSREKLVGALYDDGWTTSASTHYDHAVITLTHIKGARDLRMDSPADPAAPGRDSPEVVLQDDLRFNEHVRMFTDAEDPNHRNALAAAKMPIDERLDSPQFAACELAAQEAARRTLAHAGVPFEPFDKGLTDRCRPHWKSIASEPGAADRVEQSAARGCERMRTMMYAEPREAPKTRGARRPVGGAPPAAPTRERRPRAVLNPGSIRQGAEDLPPRTSNAAPAAPRHRAESTSDSWK